MQRLWYAAYGTNLSRGGSRCTSRAVGQPLAVAISLAVATHLGRIATWP